MSSKAKFLHLKLSSSTERCFYWAVWLTSITYPFYHAYKTSKKHFNQIQMDLTLSWLGYHKDTLDYEWTFWRTLAVLLVALFSINSTITALVKRLFPNSQHKLILLSTLLLQSAVLSINGLLLTLLVIAFSYFLVSYTKRISPIWISSIALLYLINDHELKMKCFRFLGFNEDSHDLVKLALMMSVLRIISFSTYYLRQKQDKQDNLSISKLVTFCLYIPVCYNGPIINFDTFHNNLYKEPCKYSTGEIAKDAIYTTANIFCLEMFFHLIYANILCEHHDILHQMTVLDAISLFWIHLHIFNIKYFIFYRFSGIFAKIDGIEPPGPPKCIASLYTFVDMWRYFDKGLNKFLFQNIYLPLGGSITGFGKQTLASCLCFSFVGYWHGADKSLMFWALTNWLGIVVESMGARLIKTDLYRNTVNRFGCLAHRRLCALGGAFSVFTLIFTNMVFLVGYDSAVILLQRISSVWYCPILCLFVFYCINHCSIDASYT